MVYKYRKWEDCHCESLEDCKRDPESCSCKHVKEVKPKEEDIGSGNEWEEI